MGSYRLCQGQGSTLGSHQGAQCCHCCPREVDGWLQNCSGHRGTERLGRLQGCPQAVQRSRERRAEQREPRKQTYVAGLVIRCYVDNITSNSGAKTCADRARSADVSRWNINGGTLHPCASKVANENSFGPKDWTATPGNCKGAKERNGERSSKEKASKEVKAKEASAKEKEAKAKVERDNKATKERKAKADEKKAKADEKVAKEKSSKEASAKAAAKEKTDKANEKKAKAAAAEKAKSNNAGVIYIGAHSGYTTTGGGMNNHYRSWDAKSAFEEMMPEGDRFRCDTGFGPGQLTCC